MQIKNRNSFWEALVIALFIFGIGIILGAYFENSRVSQLSDFYLNFETDISDFQTASQIMLKETNCEDLRNNSVFLADKIYEDAVKLEKYDNSNKITKELTILHRKYDVLRSQLWSNIIDSNKACNRSFNTIVYIYDYQDTTLNIRGIQGAMSNFLTDLKEKYEGSLILIPIAGDTNVLTLNVLMQKYNITSYPVIIVNEKDKFENIESLSKIEKSLQIFSDNTLKLN